MSLSEKSKSLFFFKRRFLPPFYPDLAWSQFVKPKISALFRTSLRQKTVFFGINFF